MTTPHNQVEQALALLTRARGAEAVAAMAAAAEGGDPAALFELALWTLAGDPVPRNLPRALSLLERARRGGDADAGLVEVALRANGSGGRADWATARSILQQLRDVSPAAQHHLALLDAMRLTDDGRPTALPAGVPLDPAGAITRFPQLLSAAECAHVANVASHLLQPALVVDPVTQRQVPHPIRTSDGGVIGPTREDLVIRAINQRLATISGTMIEQGESLTVLRYQPGQQYRLHLDTLPGVQNQRLATVLIYLNAGFTGGQTHFPELAVTITPQPGDAILYRNVLPDGQPDRRMSHAGLPVTRDAKWLATRWIRTRPVDPWNPDTAR